MKVLKREHEDPVKALELLSGEDRDSLKQRQKMCLEFLRRNLKIRDRESFDEMKEELSSLDKLKEKHVIKILEALPTHEEEVNALFSKERVKLDDSMREKIIETCKSFKAD
ncbi:MAG: hypothetical protein MUP58_02590 [Candidatus Nanohaloarchaeota archaeon QJJ-9]|nr:hypothetical protein [Candidatus Nanohaloarchaeota archaeon QJJ-9]